MEDIQFKVCRSDVVPPKRGDKGSAGIDLCVWCPSSSSETEGSVTIEAGLNIIHTGLIICIPEGYYGRIAPRSSLARKYGIDTMGGVIDSSYRGEIIIMLMNHSGKVFNLSHGDRAAQIIVEKIHVGNPVMVDSFGDKEETDRGTGGFGSTGK